MSRGPQHANSQTRDAVDAALAVLTEPLPVPAAFVSYNVRRCLLLIGPADAVCEIAMTLRHHFDVVAAIDGARPPRRLLGVRIVESKQVSLSGYLGRFSATGIDSNGEPIDLSGQSTNDDGCFDLVVDLSRTPVLNVALPPLGYLRLGEPDEYETALENLPAGNDEFRKPKYFSFSPEHCVHRRQQVRGCDRCIDVCPTAAISSGAQTVEVDPHLCRGCGTCSVVCPTGALTHKDPPTVGIIDRLARALRAYLSAGGTDPWIGFHMADREPMMHWAAARGITLLPFSVRSVTALGLEVWLAAIGFGAAGVVLLAPERAPATALDALSRQVHLARKILVGLGRRSVQVQLLRGDPEQEDSDVAMRPIDTQIADAWSYPTTDPDPRARLLTVFARVSSQIRDVSGAEKIALQSWATFGCVEVEHELCTMCLACTNLCPTGALRAIHDGSELGFTEAKCVQCGLCENGCPENAIKRLPRFDYQAVRDKGVTTLNRVEMANCAQCGRPFMPAALLDSVLNHLTGEGAAVRDAKAMLRVCPQCRADSVLRAQFPSVPRSSG